MIDLIKYSVQTTPIENEKGAWRSTKVEVFAYDNKVAEYTRNYPSLLSTFCPFRQKGKNYALISENYGRTSVLDLESGEIIATEETNVFCPAEFWHPNFGEPFEDWWEEEFYDGTWALVSGCVWGDDSCWKVQYLDLSKISEGKVLRDDRFGYIELGAPLKYTDFYPAEDKGENDWLYFPVRARAFREKDTQPEVFSEVKVWKQ